MLSNINRILYLCLWSIALSSTAFAQVDSTFTVEPPEGYVVPFYVEEVMIDTVAIDSVNDEVVTAATTDPDESLLAFDTTGVISLAEFENFQEQIPHVSDALIRDRLSCIENEVPLHLNSKVRSFIDAFAIKKRNYVLKMLERKNIYFPLFERELAKYGVPDELKYLAIVESGLRPKARSRAGALGLWQFMPSTGRLYGLRYNYYKDDRMDPEKATIAACKYLRDLHNMFDDWELAIAAYNCGPGNIRKAMRRSGKKKFWEIYKYLPRETRGYIPIYVAFVYLMNHVEEHNLIQPYPSYPIPSETIYVSQYVNLERFCDEIKVCYEDFQMLNPRLRLNIVPNGVENFEINIPAQRLAYFEEHRKAILDSAKSKTVVKNSVRYPSRNGSSKIYHRVRSGETLGGIASRYRVKVSDLRRWNNIRGSMIRIGQRLVVWGGKAPKPSSSGSKSKPNPNGIPIPASKIHVVKHGDNLWDIAKKYKGLTVEKIKKLNNLRSNKLKIGQKLRIG